MKPVPLVDERLAVWAPRAQRVDVLLGARGTSRHPLRPSELGWFEVERGLEDGEDYAFSLDGGPPLPDPRSLYQPRGVHAASRAVSPARFEWTAPDFHAPPLPQAVIYELHIGTFTRTGTFDAAIERLPYLRDLGVTHLEVMPIAEFPGARGWGYDGVFPYAAYSGYGGPYAFARFVDACHAHGLAVVLDVVYNHFGPEGNYVERYGPYLSPAATPWGAAVNLDGADSEVVRRYFLDNALMWLRDFHVDGLRLDAVDALYDRGPLHWLEELAEEVAELESQTGRSFLLIGESDGNDPRLTRPRSEFGHGIHAQWNEEFHRSLLTATTSERAGWYADYAGLRDLTTVLQAGFAHQGRYSTFRRRRHGRKSGSIPPQRSITYLQTHDLVGNRPQGERLGHLLSPELTRLTAAVLLLSPSVPMLFQGEEWNAGTPFLYFTDHTDAGLGRAVLAGRLRDFAGFGWPASTTPDPQQLETFQRSQLDWSELARAEHAEFLEWYRELIALRTRWPELGTAPRAELDRDCLALHRQHSSAYFNFSSQPYLLTLSGPVEIVHSSQPSACRETAPGKLGPNAITLAPLEYILLRRG